MSRRRGQALAGAALGMLLLVPGVTAYAQEDAPVAPTPIGPPPDCTIATTVQLGSSGLEVLCVELALAALGYAVVPDEDLDLVSVEAVTAFQAAEGLVADGVVGQQTAERLEIWEASGETTTTTPPPTTVETTTTTTVAPTTTESTAPTTTTSSTTTTSTTTTTTTTAPALTTDPSPTAPSLPPTAAPPPPLPTAPAVAATSAASAAAVSCSISTSVRLGSTGPDAQCVEQALADRGFTNVSVDGSFGAVDRDNLMWYQASSGLPADGVAGAVTASRLGIWGGAIAAAAVQVTCPITTTIRQGSSGGQAACVEQALYNRGFRDVSVNGSFSFTDQENLRWFQGMRGLTPDGVAGPTTASKLGIWGGTAAPPSSAGLPANSGSGRRVVYSRAQQRVWAVDANGVVVKTHRVSGRTYEPYAGTYSVYSRSMYTYSSANPIIKFRYMVRFTYGFNGGRIGFHEIPTKYGVPIQTNSQLGQPLSGGCVRQSTADAQWMWNWAGVGTKVVVL